MFTKKALTISCAVACLAAGAGRAALADEATTISGKTFLDISNIDGTSDGNKTAASGTGFDAKRLYIGVDHKFDDNWSMQAVTDFNYISSIGQTDVYIKKLFVQYKASDAFVARAGSADLPWVPFAEDVYGYRWVENVIIDRLKFGTSADWGLNANGKMGSNGMFTYSASVINGAGYKNPSRSKSMDFEGRVSITPLPGLTGAIGYYTGKLGKDIEGATTFHTADRFDVLLAYAVAGFHVGAEYFTANDWANVTTVVSDKADGYSIWASYDFTKMWSVFARADSAKPKKNTAPDLKDEYFNVGMAMHPRKNVDVALVYKDEKVSGGGGTAATGFINTSNGNIGGLVSGGKYQEIGVWAQIKF
ncbi:MAG: hypothetical protein ABI616_07880 [Pseudomonadota bacterium]